MRRIRLTALLLLVACENPTTIPVAMSISISPAELSFTAIGQTASVVATVKDQNGAPMAAMIGWMTTDESVASISSGGPASSITVTSVGTGTATIVASSYPVAVSGGVTVVQEAASVELSSDSLTFLTLGDTSRLTATVRDENGNPIDDATVNWSSSDDNTATVSSTGLVTSVQGGTATITASSDVSSSAFVHMDSAVRISVWSSISTKWDSYTCGTNSDGLAYCWGNDANGRLGDGMGSGSRLTPSSVLGEHVWSTMSAAQYHTCGATGSSALYCWGKNESGGLGDGTTADRTTPTQIGTDQSWANVNAGYDHTCAVTTSGVGYCWGDNTNGKLGTDDPASVDQLSPTAVSGSYSWKSISAGESFSCGVTTSVALLYEGYCWGNNFSGQLGIGSRSERDVVTAIPTLVIGSHSWKMISVGQSHACGVTISGEAYCWGWNTSGSVGDGTTEHRPSPTLVSGGHTWQSLSAGREHTCGVTASGDAYCWGAGGHSRLGTGGPSFSDHPTPNLVSGSHSWSMISAGWRNTCGLTTSGEAYCWGDNTRGQIGNGTTIESHEPPLATPTKVTRPWS